MSSNPDIRKMRYINEKSRFDEEELQQAFVLFQNERYSDALPLMRQLRNRGSAAASLYIGLMFRDGLGVEGDVSKAMDAFNEAGELGAPIGDFYAGHLQEMVGDIASAILSYRRSAERKNISAAYAMYRLSKKRSCDISENEASRFYKMALDGRHIYALRDRNVNRLKFKEGIAGFVKALPSIVSGPFALAYLTKSDPQNPRLY